MVNEAIAGGDINMKTSFEIAVFEGDGIGPEIMAPTLDILGELAERTGGYNLSFRPLPAGAAHYAKAGESPPRLIAQSGARGGCDLALRHGPS